jgi:hypothetical protein
MVANCEVLVVEYSTLAYVGLALGKEVHSWFDLAFLRRVMPEQHGEAAVRIARTACELMGVAWADTPTIRSARAAPRLRRAAL